MHPKGEDGTHINQTQMSADKTLVFSVDDFGLVNVYNYPALDNSHQARSYCGHSEHVLRVQPTQDSTRFFTIGG